jgi:hypothetical protein
VALTKRFKECGLVLNPDKTKIVYCKEYRRKNNYPTTQFDFLGYTFRKRIVKRNSDNTVFLSFTPAVSKVSLNAIKERIRQKHYGRRSNMSIEEIAKEFNPILRGWINYYGFFNRACLKPVFRCFNGTVRKWAMRKFRKITGKGKANRLIVNICKQQPTLFVHWALDIANAVV